MSRRSELAGIERADLTVSQLVELLILRLDIRRRSLDSLVDVEESPEDMLSDELVLSTSMRQRRRKR
jgi:hypothetical protein